MEKSPAKWLIATLVLFFLSMGPALSQNTYRVLSVKGNVYKTTDPYKTLKKRAELKLTDLVVIEPSSVLRVVVYPSGAIYTSDTPGTFRVKEILDSGKKKTENYIKAVNRQILAEKRISEDSRSRVIGAASRGETADEYLEKLAATILDDAAADHAIRVEKVKQKDCFHLRIINPEEGVLPIALFCIMDKEKRVEAVSKEPILVAEGASDIPDLIYSTGSKCTFIATPVDPFVYLPDLAMALQAILSDRN